MYWVLYLSSNGALVGVTNQDATQLGIPGVSLVSFEGACPDLNHVTWSSEELQLLPNTGRLIAKPDFLSRFTAEERITIKNSTDPIVEDIVFLLDQRDEIDLDSTTTIQSLGYLQQVGLLASGRVSIIRGV